MALEGTSVSHPLKTPTIRQEVYEQCDDSKLLTQLKNFIHHQASIAACRKENFTIGLSGNDIVELFSSILPSNLDGWRIFFCDDTFTLSSSKDKYIKAFDTVNLPPETLTNHTMLLMSEYTLLAALEYDKEMQRIFKLSSMPSEADIPSFTCLLLDLREDGSVGALYPEYETKSNFTTSNKFVIWRILSSNAQQEKKGVFGLNLSVINNSQYCIFVVRGARKAEIVKRILIDKEDLPANKINPIGKLYWLLDKEAASLIKKFAFSFNEGTSPFT